MTLYSRVRPLAFTLPPERAHALGKQALRAVQSTYPTRAAVSYAYQYDHPALEVDAFGTRFPNPVGVAAGFDKNAEVTHALESLGFRIRRDRNGDAVRPDGQRPTTAVPAQGGPRNDQPPGL